MGNYETEQGADYGGDDRPLSSDLKPWLNSQWGLDTYVTEFPYFQYLDDDHPEVVEQAEVREQDPSEITSDYIRQKGPFRTDLVAVNPDFQALRTRARRLGHLTSLNQPQQGKRRYRRTYLSFVGDGPMARHTWEGSYGHRGYGGPELRGYGEDSARRAFGWLKKRGFLVRVGNQTWDAVDIPLHIHGRAHVFELKLDRKEWSTALEQAARADVFADYRWVVYDRATADQALANTDAFRSEGVGLITVEPEDGCTVQVWAEQCTPDVTWTLLNRYNVERWDLNERVLVELAGRPDSEYPYHADGEGPRITMDSLDVETDTSPPTVHGHEPSDQPGAPEPRDDPNHVPLTSFSGDGSE